MKKIVICALLLFITAHPARSEEYAAEVTTKNGTFFVPVEVENGEVTVVYWSEEDHMPVYGGEIFEKKAWAVDSKGKNVDVFIEDYEELDREEYYAGHTHYTWDLQETSGGSDDELEEEDLEEEEEDDGYIHIRM